MKCIIAGTRTMRDMSVVEEAIKSSGYRDKITEVVCGASSLDLHFYDNGRMSANVDILGAVWARNHGIPVKHFPAAWNVYGTSAGPRRNRQMAEYADALILVWDGYSRGSESMLEEANLRRDMDIFIYRF